MLKGILLALLSASCYATLVIFGKVANSLGLSAVHTLTLRFEFGIFFFALYLLIFDRKKLIPSKRLLFKTAFLGLFFYVGQSLALFKSVEYIPASTASLILYLYPLAVLILSVIFLKERFRASSLVSVVLILGGCCLVFYDAFLREISPVGMAYAVTAMVLFSVYMIVNQLLLKSENPISSAFYVMLFTSLGFIALNGGLGLQDITYQQTLLGVSLGIVPSAIAMALLYKSIEKIGAAYVSIFSSVEPMVTLLLASVFLGEKIAEYQIFGVILLIAGIVLPNLRMLRR